jgi:uncharacterized protein DUF5943
MTMSLSVEIDVDPVGGRWSVDGVAMVLVPRHLITNNLQAVEERLGQDSAAALFRPSGYRSAQEWCAHQSARTGLHGSGLVRHYLEQMSRRGWGEFTILQLDVVNGSAKVCVDHSALAHREISGNTGGCYMFAGWLEGALDYARRGISSAPSLEVREMQCAAAGAGRCIFEVIS